MRSRQFLVLIAPLAFAACAAPGGDTTESDPASDASPAVLGSGDAAAQAGPATPSKRDFVAELPVRVENDEELQRMRDYLESRYDREGLRRSFRLPSGMVVDCVDVDKQPGLSRPEMKGHVIAPPPGAPAPAGVQTPDDMEAFLHEGRLNAEGEEMSCPENTIPIRRIGLEQAKRFRNVDDMMAKYPRDLGGDVQRDPSQGHLFIEHPAASGLEAPRVGSANGHQYAHAVQWLTNNGANTTMNVWAPAVDAPFEFSLSQIWVVAGGGANLQTLEAGWQVAPGRHLFDAPGSPHLFIYSTSDNYQGQSCYDLDCGRFVQVDNRVVIGGSLQSSVSAFGGYQGELNVMFYLFNGNWWLGANGIWVGYYPGALFNAAGLANGASRIDFGGEIVDSRIWPWHTGHTGTDMGSGIYPQYGQGWAAYHRNIYFWDATGAAYYVNGLVGMRDDSYCYDITLAPGASSFFYGGPGYNVDCQ